MISILLRYELPEVPSCRRNDYSLDESRERWDGSDPSGLKHDPDPAWHFDNSALDVGRCSDESKPVHEFHLIYKQLVPLDHGDHVPPMPVKSAPSSAPPFYGD